MRSIVAAGCAVVVVAGSVCLGAVKGATEGQPGGAPSVAAPTDGSIVVREAPPVDAPKITVAAPKSKTDTTVQARVAAKTKSPARSGVKKNTHARKTKKDATEKHAKSSAKKNAHGKKGAKGATQEHAKADTQKGTHAKKAAKGTTDKHAKADAKHGKKSTASAQSSTKGKAHTAKGTKSDKGHERVAKASKKRHHADAKGDKSKKTEAKSKRVAIDALVGGLPPVADRPPIESCAPNGYWGENRTDNSTDLTVKPVLLEFATRTTL